MPTIHLYRRPGETRNWYALVYVHGKRHRFSCKTDNTMWEEFNVYIKFV